MISPIMNTKKNNEAQSKPAGPAGYLYWPDTGNVLRRNRLLAKQGGDPGRG
jgi:hypothetical protein